MKDLFLRFESLTRQWGAEIGRSIAERMVAERFGAGLPKAEAPPPAVEKVVQTAPRHPKPTLLPGLAGRRRRPGEPPPKCGRPGCEKPSRTRGYCQTHYVQWLKAGR